MFLKNSLEPLRTKFINIWLQYQKRSLREKFCDLSKISDVVKNNVIKQTEYNELVKKVNAIDKVDLLKKQIMILGSIRIKVKNT